MPGALLNAASRTDILFECINAHIGSFTTKLTSTMRRTARTRLGQGGGWGCARPSARQPGRV